MTPSSTFLVPPESGPMLFADCPFCLRPLPFDLEAGSMDCPDCQVHVALAPDPEPAGALAPAA
jgi:hypothetical protein